MSRNIKHLLLSVLFAMLLALSACGGGEPAAPAVEEAAAPLAELEEEPAEEEAAEEPAEEAPAEEEAAEEMAEEEMAFDLVAAIDEEMSTIPDGFFAVGALDAFKDAMGAGNVILIDVREVGEYEEGHIEGAVNVPIRTLAQNLDKVPADQPVFIYCASGHRAAMATSALNMLGYTNVRAYPPGMKGWTAAEEPVSTEPVEGESYAVPEINAELLAAVDGFLSGIPEGFLVVRSVDDLTAAQDAGAFVLDVRQPDEFERGAIPGAVNIPVREIAARLDEIPTDQPIVTYCASGFRSGLALASLQSLGYTNARSFPAGYGAWEAAQGEAGELPAESAAASPAEGDIVAVVDAYLSSVPEGFMAVGQIDAFKEILASGAAVLIDVREPGEYEAGHIEGAVNVPIRTLAQNLDKIPTDQPVMVYCASGHRAGMATSALRMLGYDNVRSYPPGWKGWTAAEEAVSTEMVEGETYELPEIDAAALAAVDGFLANIPEGFYSIGQVDALEAAVDAGAVLIDVREPGEFEAGHIPDAINVPLRTLAQSLDLIPTEGPVIVYCASGHRAALSLAALQTMGFDNTRAFPPGYGGWEAGQ